MRFDNFSPHDTQTTTSNAGTNLVSESQSAQLKQTQHKACNDASDSLTDFADFSQGIFVGAAGGGIDFIEFVANPNSVHHVIDGTAKSLSIAGDYYRDKLAHGRLDDIAKDAGTAVSATGDWLTDYGKKQPYERGKLTGHLTADVLLAETGVQVAKAACNGLKVAAEASTAGDASLAYARSGSERFEEFFQGLNDSTRKAVGGIERARPSAEFARNLDWLIEELPEGIQQFLAEKNVTIVPLRNLEQYVQGFNRIDGVFMNRADGPYIMLAEDLHRLSGSIDLPKLTLSLRHEITHAIDNLSAESGWLSDSKEIQRAFVQDLAALSPTKQKWFMEHLGKGDFDRLRREMVAEVVSRRAVPFADELDYVFIQSFRNLDKLLRGGQFPWNAHTLQK